MNCDDLVGVADVTALMGYLPTGAFGPCRGADVNRDGVVNELDLEDLVILIFGTQAQS